MSGANVLPPGTAVTISAFSMAAPRNGFAFLTNVLRIVGASELELIPGHMLRRVTVDEIKIIKEILVENNGRLGGKYFFPWEMESKDGGFDTAPEEDWNYFVIAFSGTNDGINRLDQAFVLLDSSPRIGFTIMNWGPGRAVTLHAGRLFQALQENSMAFQANRMDEHIVTVDAEHAVHVRRLVQQLSEHPAAAIDVPRVSQQLLNLQALDANSDVAFLGYFSVLESLLIHKPDPKDPNDSITRQMKKKITLLDNRWVPKIDYSTFDASKPEAIWGKMYELRSAIAHGDAPDFRNSLKNLKDLANARSLLIRTVRAVARYALHEPQLVADLREC
jgi:Apea-like HEPN